MASVLVTDGDERAALAVVRSLGRAGHTVHVEGRRRRSLAALSRHAHASFAAPDPLTAPGPFVDATAEYARAHAIDIILPIAEPALLAVTAARGRCAPALIPFPPLDTVLAIHDKRGLQPIAERVGIAFPEQWTVPSASALDQLAVESLPYPVVIKPSRSVASENGTRSKHTVKHAADADELARHIGALSAGAFPLLIQRRIVGPGRGVFLLRWEGRTVAAFAHERIREKPPAGGVSVHARSVALEPGLLELSERLLDAFAWNGVAMIEYKLDAASGTPYLMEINGRFWGSLQLAIDAGVDFPALLVASALGARVDPITTYRVGAQGRWWWGEVDHVLARFRRSDRQLSLPPDAPTRAAAARDFMSRWSGDQRDAVLRFDDPLPFLYESVRWLRPN